MARLEPNSKPTGAGTLNSTYLCQSMVSLRDRTTKGSAHGVTKKISVFFGLGGRVSAASLSLLTKLVEEIGYPFDVGGNQFNELTVGPVILDLLIHHARHDERLR